MTLFFQLSKPFISRFVVATNRLYNFTGICGFQLCEYLEKCLIRIFRSVPTALLITLPWHAHRYRYSALTEIIIA